MSEAKQFGEEVATLKLRIQERVQQAVLDFFLATGMTPSGIDIDMRVGAQIGDKVTRYMVGDVTVEFRHL